MGLENDLPENSLSVSTPGWPFAYVYVYIYMHTYTCIHVYLEGKGRSQESQEVVVSQHLKARCSPGRNALAGPWSANGV